MKEVQEFLRKTGVYYFATIHGDHPEVRPFGVAVIFENRLYIETGRKKEVYRELLANPKASICAFDGSTWLRINATFVEDKRVEAEAAVLDEYPELKNMYQAGDGNTAVFYMKDATATFSSFVAAPRTIKF
jgi:uncharacterized pyridoxamine 5'-phosphate oxidase family protein